MKEAKRKEALWLQRQQQAMQFVAHQMSMTGAAAVGGGVKNQAMQLRRISQIAHIPTSQPTVASANVSVVGSTTPGYRLTPLGTSNNSGSNNGSGGKSKIKTAKSLSTVTIASPPPLGVFAGPTSNPLASAANSLSSSIVGLNPAVLSAVAHLSSGPIPAFQSPATSSDLSSVTAARLLKKRSSLIDPTVSSLLDVSSFAGAAAVLSSPSRHRTLNQSSSNSQAYYYYNREYRDRVEKVQFGAGGIVAASGNESAIGAGVGIGVGAGSILGGGPITVKDMKV